MASLGKEIARANKKFDRLVEAAIKSKLFETTNNTPDHVRVTLTGEVAGVVNFTAERMGSRRMIAMTNGNYTAERTNVSPKEAEYYIQNLTDQEVTGIDTVYDTRLKPLEAVKTYDPQATIIMLRRAKRTLFPKP